MMAIHLSRKAHYNLKRIWNLQIHQSIYLATCLAEMLDVSGKPKPKEQTLPEKNQSFPQGF